VLEVAAAIVLLAGAGLMLRSFFRMQNVNPGFDPSGLVSFQMGAAHGRYPGLDEQAAFYRRVVERVREVPGVVEAAAAHRLPLYPNPSAAGYEEEGRPIPKGAPGPTADIRVVTPGLFRTMRIPLLEGRDVSDRDTRESPPVIVVSESLAREQWPGESPIGKRIRLGAIRDRSWEIVGVASDVKMRALDRDTGAAAIYGPAAQNLFPTALRSAYLLVRSAAVTPALVSSIRDAVREIDPGEGLAKARTLDEVIAASGAPRRLNTILLLIFSAIAAEGDLLRMVFRQGMILVGFGIAASLAASLALTRMIQGLLFDVPASDPATLLAVSALLLAVSGVAVFIPARRASRVDPLIALRSE